MNLNLTPFGNPTRKKKTDPPCPAPVIFDTPQQLTILPFADVVSIDDDDASVSDPSIILSVVVCCVACRGLRPAPTAFGFGLFAFLFEEASVPYSGHSYQKLPPFASKLKIIIYSQPWQLRAPPINAYPALECDYTLPFTLKEYLLNSNIFTC